MSFFTITLANTQNLDDWRVITNELEDQLHAHANTYHIYRTDTSEHQSIRFVFEVNERTLKRVLWDNLKWYETNWGIRLNLFKLSKDSDWENNGDWI